MLLNLSRENRKKAAHEKAAFFTNSNVELLFKFVDCLAGTDQAMSKLFVNEIKGRPCADLEQFVMQNSTSFWLIFSRNQNGVGMDVFYA